MPERNYEISEPFDTALNKRLNEYTGVVSQGKPGHDDPQEILPLPEDSIEARLVEAAQAERETCANECEGLSQHLSAAGDLQGSVAAARLAARFRGDKSEWGEDDGEEGNREDGAETEGNVSPE